MIKNALRFKPFSHLPGTLSIIPGTSLACSVFPARLQIYCLQKKPGQKKPELIHEFTLSNFGPCSEFTITLNLEQGCLEVSGFHGKQFFRYQIFGTASGFGLRFLKVAPESTLNDTQLTAKKTLYFPKQSEEYTVPKRARLSLGCSKAQNAQLIASRMQPEEFLPILFFLSQTIPQKMQAPTKGPSLAQDLRLSIENKKHVYETLQNIYQAGFSSLFFPHVQDQKSLGFPYPVTQATSPLTLLHELYIFILSIFFQEDGTIFDILPGLPEQFHAGKLTEIPTQNAIVSLEWSKKIIRRIQVHALDDFDCTFSLHHVKSFRFHNKRYQNKQTIFLKKGHTYLFDNFQK